MRSGTLTTDHSEGRLSFDQLTESTFISNNSKGLSLLVLHVSDVSLVIFIFSKITLEMDKLL